METNEKYEDMCQKRNLIPTGNILSETEQALFDLIKTSEERVTIKLIELKLSQKAVGALGKLLGKELIESKKDRGDSSYGKKQRKYYVVKEEK